ncbi:hypothetical protein TNCV_39171 [Trichonephila clavipes]|nr:hypothetical protein TNCV_39171 [Trichonephila clavipes]
MTPFFSLPYHFKELWSRTHGHDHMPIGPPLTWKLSSGSTEDPSRVAGRMYVKFSVGKAVVEWKLGEEWCAFRRHPRHLSVAQID